MCFYRSLYLGKPKGALYTHSSIHAQASMLVKAWEWKSTDRILHVLPLQHVHGIVNVLTCCLLSGAVCEMVPSFHPPDIWRALCRHGSSPNHLTLFMAVPTIYVKLIQLYEDQTSPTQQRLTSRIKQSGIRLMVSGSAPLPASVQEKWRNITGFTLLERFGMTECGMALSHLLHGERKAGSVGVPLPGVEAKIVDEKDPSKELPQGFVM